jgi:hypothetical protein
MGVRSSIQQSSVVLQGIVDTGPSGLRRALDDEATALALAAGAGVPESATAVASGGGNVGGAVELAVGGGETLVAGNATACSEALDEMGRSFVAQAMTRTRDAGTR